MWSSRCSATSPAWALAVRSGACSLSTAVWNHVTYPSSFLSLGLCRHFSGWRSDLAIVVAITALAAGLRLWHLETVPLGLHGDEAWTGIDARRVLDEGWIGPYLPSALGQPIGPAYFTALLFSFLPDTTYTLRFSMALFGIATIPVAYCAFAGMFSRTVAAFAALLLAVMMWHLHLSRTGFMVSSWPFIEMAAMLALWRALRRRGLLRFALAGMTAGLGLYTYNAYLLFLPLLLVALVWTYVVGGEARWPWRTALASTSAMACVALTMSIPMIRYAKRHSADFRYHWTVVGLTHGDAWKAASLTEKADLLWGRAKEWGHGLVRGNRPDLGDALATEGHPPVDPIVALFALAGIGVAVWNWRRAEYAVLLAALLLLPEGALLTVGDGLFRRTLGLAPFVAVLAALPLDWIWRRGGQVHGLLRSGCFALVLLMPAIVGVRTTHAYFSSVQDSRAVRTIFPYQLDAACRYMQNLSGATHVYFYSERWSFDYETRRFLVPAIRGTDRSRRFRDAQEPRDAPLDFTADRERDVAFVFLAPYVDEVDKVRERYPGGVETEARRGEEILYRAYYLRAEK